MSRLGLRSLAFFAIAAATPFAARHYASRSSLPAESSPVLQQPADSTPSSRLKPALNSLTAPPAADSTPDSDAAPNAREIAAASNAAERAGQASLGAAVCRFLEEYAAWQPANAIPADLPGHLPCTRPADPAVDPGATPQLLVAVLPDPARTHLELRFDRAIDDIQHAAQERGWQFDSDWLPWSNQNQQQPERFGDHLLDETAKHGRESVPGALLFRPARPDAAGSARTPLIVLLTGETPTGGIDADQFRSALAMWHALQQPGADGHELAILGPVFSGSAQSLIQLLQPELPATAASPDQQPCDDNRIRIASGSLSHGEQLRSLDETLKKSCAPHEVVSFGMDISYASDMLLRFLKRKHPDAVVAALTEEETTFGSGGSICDPNHNCGPVVKSDLNLHFPREISRLREAYEKSGIIGFGTSSDTTPRSELQLDTGTEHHATDTVPAFSGSEAILSMESEMAAIVSTLNQQHVSTVLLSATDVFDEIFVARYLEQHAPRTTVIIGDADLLFLRRGQDANLPYAYVASPWPLIGENQAWTADRPNEPIRTIYPSQSDQGLRAAALHLLPCPAGQVCSAAPAEYRSPLQGDSQFDQHPPLWLSAIGRAGFAPIALVDSDVATHGEPVTPPIYNLPSCDVLRNQQEAFAHGAGQTVTLRPCPPASVSSNAAPQPASRLLAPGLTAEVPLQTKLLIFAVALLLAWHVLACVLSRVDRRFAWSYALADAPHHVRRLSLQAALSLTAIPAVLLLEVPSKPGFSIQSGSVYVAGWFIQTAAIISALYSLLRLCDLRVSSRTLRFRLLLAAALVLSVGTALLNYFIFLAPLQHFGASSSESALALYRSSLMQPGISPRFTLLLLFGTLVYWLHSRFARLAFFGHRIPLLPSGYAHHGCPDPARVEPVTNLFSGTDRAHVAIVLGSAAAVFSALCTSHDWGPSALEAGSFQSAVRWATALIATLILTDIAVAAWGWHQLHQNCLLDLKRSPLRWGFSWIQGFSWKRIWTGARVLSPDILFDYLSRIQEANRRKALHDPLLEAAFRSLRTAYYQPLSDLSWSEDIAAKFRDLHCQTAQTARWKLGELDQVWQCDEGPLTGASPERGMPLLEPLTDLDGVERQHALDRMAREEFVALLYLGYIRMVLIQIRSRVVTALICFVLLLWALTSYSWTNHHAVIVGMSALLAVVSAAVIYIYAGMHSDEILSRTTETEPGKLNSAFFEKIIPTLAIPILSLVATQFPEFSDLIFSFIEPGLRGH